ncbi:unnamed protein product [Cuscuta campestris]|uniref:Reverse transcriptase zinc-binding domain-containing protein n=1 Tax=Cuscuta campestris TaxID=132261 RepID=A0A484NDB3_9ASTE|nr:unnamed protein product [Cuscuta campestris]
MICAKDRSGHYAVKSTYKSLAWDDLAQGEGTSNRLWRKIWAVWTMPDIRSMVCRVVNDIVPCLSNLVLKRVPVENVCPLCHASKETILHIFFTCPFAA